jgi:hypothetical protein
VHRNAIDVRTGANWGCDRDGDPVLTRGCGWYVDIDHTGGIVTRYCHQAASPAVQVGQQVTAMSTCSVTTPAPPRRRSRCSSFRTVLIGGSTPRLPETCPS